MATTYTVTSTTDNSNDPSYSGSLRSALSQAQDGDIIVFDSSISNQTITLSSTLNVTKGVTIDGGTSGVVISHVASSNQNPQSFPDFTVDAAGAAPATIKNLAINDGTSTGSKGVFGSSGAPGTAGTNGGKGGPGGPGGTGQNTAGGIYVKSGAITLTDDSFANDTATGGMGGFGGSGGSDASDNGKGASGPGGMGGNAAGAVYVEDGATVTASNLTFVKDSSGVDTNQGAPGAGGYGTPTGSSGQGFADSNNAAVNAAAVCYVSGTLIRSTRGDVAVEQLAIGDSLETASGQLRSIKWLGHRTTDCRNHPRPHEAKPIRIAAHAFGENRPARDLFVSPGHAICVDVLGEVLIPAVALVNGSTIQQIDVDAVTYWHVELESHDVILAENLPAESYLDMGNRDFFAEGPIVALTALPDADPALRTHADFCRPFVDGGPVLEAVRLLLRQRAEALGWRSSDVLDMHLVVDGQRLDPVVRGLTARFHVPFEAKDVWLVSPTARPRDVAASGDGRDLGLYIGGLRIDDGFATRDIAVDDPLLCVGFHAVEDSARRWTSGRARLPAALWEGCEGDFYLRVDLAGMPVPRWTAPAVASAEAVRPRLAIVA